MVRVTVREGSAMWPLSQNMLSICEELAEAPDESNQQHQSNSLQSSQEQSNNSNECAPRPKPQPKTNASNPVDQNPTSGGVYVTRSSVICNRPEEQLENPSTGVPRPETQSKKRTLDPVDQSSNPQLQATTSHEGEQPQRPHSGIPNPKIQSKLIASDSVNQSNSLQLQPRPSNPQQTQSSYSGVPRLQTQSKPSDWDSVGQSSFLQLPKRPRHAQEQVQNTPSVGVQRPETCLFALDTDDKSCLRELKKRFCSPEEIQGLDNVITPVKRYKAEDSKGKESQSAMLHTPRPQLQYRPSASNSVKGTSFLKRLEWPCYPPKPLQGSQKEVPKPENQSKSNDCVRVYQSCLQQDRKLPYEPGKQSQSPYPGTPRPKSQYKQSASGPEKQSSLRQLKTNPFYLEEQPSSPYEDVAKPETQSKESAFSSAIENCIRQLLKRPCNPQQLQSPNRTVPIPEKRSKTNDGDVMYKGCLQQDRKLPDQPGGLSQNLYTKTPSYETQSKSSALDPADLSSIPLLNKKSILDEQSENFRTRVAKPKVISNPSTSGQVNKICLQQILKVPCYPETQSGRLRTVIPDNQSKRKDSVPVYINRVPLLRKLSWHSTEQPQNTYIRAFKAETQTKASDSDSVIQTDHQQLRKRSTRLEEIYDFTDLKDAIPEESILSASKSIDLTNLQQLQQRQCQTDEQMQLPCKNVPLPELQPISSASDPVNQTNYPPLQKNPFNPNEQTQHPDTSVPKQETPSKANAPNPLNKNDHQHIRVGQCQPDEQLKFSFTNDPLPETQSVSNDMDTMEETDPCNSNDPLQFPPMKRVSFLISKSYLNSNISDRAAQAVLQELWKGRRYPDQQLIPIPHIRVLIPEPQSKSNPSGLVDQSEILEYLKRALLPEEQSKTLCQLGPRSLTESEESSSDLVNERRLWLLGQRPDHLEEQSPIPYTQILRPELQSKESVSDQVHLALSHLGEGTPILTAGIPEPVTPLYPAKEDCLQPQQGLCPPKAQPKIPGKRKAERKPGIDASTQVDQSVIRQSVLDCGVLFDLVIMVDDPSVSVQDFNARLANVEKRLE